MELLLLACFITAVVAAPTPLAANGDPIELIVNGLAEGEALEISDLVDIKLKKHVNDEVVSVSNVLYPYSAQGIAEGEFVAAPAGVDSSDNINYSPVVVDNPVIKPVVVLEPVVAENNTPDMVLEPVVIPEQAMPEVVPEPVIVLEPALPEIVPEPVIVPEPILPEVVPEPVIVPEPAIPEIIPEPVILVPEAEIVPEPVHIVEGPQIPNGEIFNNGLVQVSLHTPDETGVLYTIQSWFGLVLNYFNNGVQMSQQII